MEKTVFFAKEGEKGLNETSAQHLCALASQLKTDAEAKLNNLSFVNTEVNIVGSDANNMPVAIGITEDQLEMIPKYLEQISEANAFIAWFAEARETLERERRSILNMKFQNDVSAPISPESPDGHTLQDIINEMDVKERQLYLKLEAKSAVLGKFIHPNGPMYKARNMAFEIDSKPYMTSGDGSDLLVYKRTPSVDLELLEDRFIKLQAEYRRTEQSLNRMKSDLRKKLDERDLEDLRQYRLKLAEYKEAYAKYVADCKDAEARFEEWRTQELAKLSKVKFVIPDNLRDYYMMLQNTNN